MRLTPLKTMLVACLLVFGWLATVGFGGLSGWWMSSVVEKEDNDGFFKYAVDALEKGNEGASALVLITNGKLAKQYHASPTETVGADSLFSVASMSKWVAAYAMMTLVDDGRADLDVPVSKYLTRWQLPDSEFDNDAVTIRRLLSHTAGFGDGLGFGEYAVDEPRPSLVDELSNPRASSGKAVSIAVTTAPGSEWRYSGGSYLLIELLIEELSGQTYEDYMRSAVFEPLGMTRAGFNVLDSDDNSSGLYQVDGTQVASPYYASKAATGLNLTSRDLSRFVLSQIDRAAKASPVASETIRSMREPHGRKAGADIWGAGTMLYAPTAAGDFVFGHDGGNDPAVNSAARINPDTGDALIVLVSGHPSLATTIGSEWVLWQTGYPDVLALDAAISSMVLPAIVGSIFILFFIFLIGRLPHWVPG